MSRVLPLVLFMCACRTVTQAIPPPSPVWEVPITLEKSGLPLVQATIGGKQTLLIVDTGAPELALQAWFVKSLEIEPTEFEGRRVVELPIQLGAHDSRKKWSLVETVPDQRELGIGGTLSPQKLLDGGAVVIDFPGKRLLALKGKQQQAWMLWLDERSPKGQVEAMPRTAPFGGGLHVKTRVGDGKEVPTRLASAQLQTAYAKDLFDPSLLAGAQHLAGVHIRTGDSEFGPIDVLVRDAEAPVQGWLGLDVLSNVVLLVPVHEMAPIWLMTPR